MQVSNLRLEIGGFPVNDYRIIEGDLEFRTLSSNGHSYRDSRSSWRKLTPGEIALHFGLNTIVGQWLTDKLAGAQQEEECQHNSASVA
jgi:hypothetical protein